LKTQGNSNWLPNSVYVIEIKALNLNSATLVVAPASKSDKIDHQNIAPGGDFTRQLGKNWPPGITLPAGQSRTSSPGNPL